MSTKKRSLFFKQLLKEIHKETKKILCLTSALLLALMISACQSVPMAQLNEDDGIVRIRKNFENKNWPDVATDVDEYKIRYPYSKYMAEAELLQANALYEDEKYPEAIAAYEEFTRKNPYDKELPLAAFRIAQSYDFQAPTTEDRDPTYAKVAVEKYRYLIKNFPNSPNVETARKREGELLRHIAENINFIANYYWEKDLYAGALSRYLTLLPLVSTYPDLKTEAQNRIAGCYLALADELEKNPDSDQWVFFKEETPQSLRKKAENYQIK